MEITVVVFSLLGSVAGDRNRVESWPVGIVGVALTAWVVFQGKLYSGRDSERVRSVSGFYGWWAWKQRRNGGSCRSLCSHLAPESDGSWGGSWYLSLSGA